MPNSVSIYNKAKRPLYGGQNLFPKVFIHIAKLTHICYALEVERIKKELGDRVWC